MPNAYRYNDSVYGSVTITEPVVLEIIQTPEFARLKDVDQGGYYEVHFPGSKHNRFDHSLGVYELLRRFGAPLVEQVAGLLHDVSHSAFSHTIDYIVSDGSSKYQTYQDDILPDYLRRASIAKVLARYGMSVAEVTDDRNFPLKETELPELCADRLDYSLRGFLAFQVVPPAAVRTFLTKLQVRDRHWVFADKATAGEYARLFKELNDIYYAGPPTAHMFYSTACYLRHAINTGYITKDDLYTSDSLVLAKIKPYHASDAELYKFFLRMDNQTRWEVGGGETAISVHCKSRCVDPLCLHEGKVARFSELMPAWQSVVAETLQPRKHRLVFYD